MKYLSDYITEAQSELFKELGVFFAFGREQFDKGVEKNKHLKPEGTKWTDMGAGMFLPSVNREKFLDRHNEIVQAGIKSDLTENGKDKVLQRELGNHEIGYSNQRWNDENFLSSIACYGFTEEEIIKGYKYHMKVSDY